MKLIFFANIFDEKVKKQREVTKLSMASSNKVLSFCSAMSNYSKIFNKQTIHVVSLGITNIQNGFKIFAPRISKNNGYAIHYGLFIRYKIVRDLASTFWSVIKCIKLVKKGDLLKTDANIDLIAKHYKFFSKTKIQEGIQKFVIWYKNYHNV